MDTDLSDPLGPPNVVLIMTDQQRYDSIAALGFEEMHTPVLDHLVRDGLTFDSCFITAPVCVPSRASFFTGLYPHANHVYRNLDGWCDSWVSRFQSEGYHTVNIGKMHTLPLDAACGFDQRMVVENKVRPLKLDQPHGAPFDEYDKFLATSGVEKPSEPWYPAHRPDFGSALGAYEWHHDEKFHPDAVVGRMAQWFIETRESSAPLFLQIGFPGPHPPYDPPGRFLDLYDGVQMRIPTVTEAELQGQPPHHRVYREEMINGAWDGIGWTTSPTLEQLERLRRHYAANVSMIDEQIGRIIESLDRRGYLNNCIVVFTSDHGDCLGDHGHIQKWTMYDQVIRVPAIIWAPRHVGQGMRFSSLVQHFDLAATLFELAGLSLDWPRSAESLVPLINGTAPGRNAVFAEQITDEYAKDINFCTMIRTDRWKLVHYLDQDWGELYNLEEDPDELHNLWFEPAMSTTRQDLLDDIRDWRIRDTYRLGAFPHYGPEVYEITRGH